MDLQQLQAQVDEYGTTFIDLFVDNVRFMRLQLHDEDLNDRLEDRITHTLGIDNWNYDTLDGERIRKEIY